MAVEEFSVSITCSRDCDALLIAKLLIWHPCEWYRGYESLQSFGVALLLFDNSRHDVMCYFAYVDLLWRLFFCFAVKMQTISRFHQVATIYKRMCFSTLTRCLTMLLDCRWVGSSLSIFAWCDSEGVFCWNVSPIPHVMKCRVLFVENTRQRSCYGSFF